MVEIKKLFKWDGGRFFAYSGEYWAFKSKDTIVKRGVKIPKWEILIAKDHPIFANIELKQDDINEIFTVDYEITFDPEKGKTNLNTGEVLGNNERHYKATDLLNLKEIVIDTKNSDDQERERERERETNPTITNSDCWVRGYN